MLPQRDISSSTQPCNDLSSISFILVMIIIIIITMMIL